MEIEIIELPWGFGYKVGSVYQEYNPNESGFVPMTEDEATQFANEVKQRLES